MSSELQLAVEDGDEAMSKRLKQYRHKTMTKALKVPTPIFTIDVTDLPELARN